VLVQALVAQATIERFYEAILLRLSRRDVMPLNAGVLAPGEDSMTGQLALASKSLENGGRIFFWGSNQGPAD
jgi:hypothetical protein